MWADGWRLFRRETSLTDAVLRPPLAGKEVEKGFLNFDPMRVDVTSGLNPRQPGENERFVLVFKTRHIGFSSET